MSDPLGAFLTAYDWYLDGRLDYSDLPRTIYPGDPMSPYRDSPKTLTEERLNSHDHSRMYINLAVLKWASRMTWHLAAIGVLLVAVAMLFAMGLENKRDIMRLQHRVETLECAGAERVL